MPTTKAVLGRVNTRLGIGTAKKKHHQVDGGSISTRDAVAGRSSRGRNHLRPKPFACFRTVRVYIYYTYTYMYVHTELGPYAICIRAEVYIHRCVCVRGSMVCCMLCVSTSHAGRTLPRGNPLRRCALVRRRNVTEVRAAETGKSAIHTYIYICIGRETPLVRGT